MYYLAYSAGILSWIIGGFAVLILGIIYCELGAALPRAGGIIRYPVFSHTITRIFIGFCDRHCLFKFNCN